jgi:phage shock protein E
MHCASGGRSIRALVSFEVLGFQSVAHLDGGFQAWQRAGQPVQR